MNYYHPSVLSLIGELLHKPGPVDVGHYTKLENLPHLFGVSRPVPPVFTRDKEPEESQNIGWVSAWGTPVQFLNDRNELDLGLQIMLDAAENEDLPAKLVLEVFKDVPGSLPLDVFQLSFSASTDDLGQWRGYGDDGFGCSIVVSTDELQNVGDAAGWVIYDKSEQESFAREVLSAIRSTTDVDLMMKAILLAASFMKHPSFIPEREFRVARFWTSEEVGIRSVGRRLAPYIDLLRSRGVILRPTRLILGPSWQLATLTKEDRLRNHVFQGVSRLLRLSGLDDTLIDVSDGLYDPR